MPPHDRSADRRSKRSAPPPPSAPPDLWVGIAQSLSANGDHRRRTAKTAEHVALAIVHDIVAGGMATGDRLPSEAAMLTQYRVSRSSLREGLRLLEVQGLIRLKPGPVGGAVVGTVDPRNLARISTLYLHLGGAHYRDLFHTHLLIEPLVAELAARNPDRDRVREQLAPFLERDLPLTGAGYRDITSDFHGTVQALVDNRVLELFVRVVGHIVLEHVMVRMDSTPLRESIHQEHRDIARAIIAGQPTRARRLMKEHFEGLWDYYRSYWPARFDQLIEWS